MSQNRVASMQLAEGLMAEQRQLIREAKTLGVHVDQITAASGLGRKSVYLITGSTD